MWRGGDAWGRAVLKQGQTSGNQYGNINGSNRPGTTRPGLNDMTVSIK